MAPGKIKKSYHPRLLLMIFMPLTTKAIVFLVLFLYAAPVFPSTIQESSHDQTEEFFKGAEALSFTQRCVVGVPVPMVTRCTPSCYTPVLGLGYSS